MLRMGSIHRFLGMVRTVSAPSPRRSQSWYSMLSLASLYLTSSLHFFHLSAFVTLSESGPALATGRTRRLSLVRSVLRLIRHASGIRSKHFASNVQQSLHVS